MRIFGNDTSYVHEFNRIEFYPRVYGPDPAVQAARNADAKNCGFQHVDGFMASLINEVEEFGLLGPTNEPDTLATINRICDRFHLVACQLRKRRGNRRTLVVRDEYDVQDLLHSLLRLQFDDVRTEEWTPSYAGASARMDFILPPQQIVVEAKMTRPTLGPKQLGDELLVDIARYARHSSCKRLVCFIYDPDELVPNPAGLEADLSRKEGDLSVTALVRPRR